MNLYTETFYSRELSEIINERRFIDLMLQTEAAMALAQAEAEIIPKEAAHLIKERARVELIDIEKLKSEIVLGGNAAIPLVKQLTTLVKLSDFEASKFVHLGATSQDIVDTATVLLIKDVNHWFLGKLQELENELRHLTKVHRETLMIGRTLLQQAKPITFGYKTSRWLSTINQDRIRLINAQEDVNYLQLGGAVGAGNYKINKEVKASLAEKLGLNNESSWHSSRGNLCFFAASLGILSGNLGKIAKDITLLMQTEVGEVFEGAADGKGVSSTMPHKRNPVNSSLITANATRTPALVATMLSAMPQEHERSAGLWHAEWETLVSIIQLVGGSLEKSIDLIKNLEVDKNQMLLNLEKTNGLIYAENVSLALAHKMGKIKAHDFVQRACKSAVKQNKHLQEILLEQNLDIDNINELFDARSSVGHALEIIDETLAK